MPIRAITTPIGAITMPIYAITMDRSARSRWAVFRKKYKLQPSVFYGWQRALFERAPQVFVESRTTPAETVKRELGGKVEQLEAKLAKKDGVIAELSEALVDLKKELGEL